MLLKIWSACGFLFTAAVWCRCFGADRTVSAGINLPAVYAVIGVICLITVMYCILLRGERDWYREEAERFAKMLQWRKDNGHG